MDQFKAIKENLLRGVGHLDPLHTPTYLRLSQKPKFVAFFFEAFPKKTLTHTLSPLQLVVGDDHLIYHGINLAIDAFLAAGKQGLGCGILDTDLVAGFDFMTLDWCLKVLRKKSSESGLHSKT